MNIQRVNNLAFKAEQLTDELFVIDVGKLPNLVETAGGVVLEVEIRSKLPRSKWLQRIESFQTKLLQCRR